MVSIYSNKRKIVMFKNVTSVQKGGVLIGQNRSITQRSGMILEVQIQNVDPFGHGTPAHAH